MKYTCLAAGIAAALLITLSACGAVSPQETLSRELGVDLSSGTAFSSYDTHGGNGDGTSCTVLDFTDHSLAGQLEDASDWTPLPLDPTAQALVYGISEDTVSIGPFLTDADGTPLVPEIQTGYYRLLDRQHNKEPPLLERFSFNFTLALYDTDTDRLYVCELDT